MNIGFYIRIDTIKPDGTVILGEQKKANSLVQAFIGMLGKQFVSNTPGTSISIKDTGGTNRGYGISTQYYYTAINFDAGAGDDNLGIVVGTDNTAVAITDYNLGSKIANGAGAGQLTYSALECPVAYTISGGDAYWDIRRTVTNDSGSDITVEEVGIIAKPYSSTSYRFLIDRTLNSFTIPAGEGKVITYTLKATV